MLTPLDLKPVQLSAAHFILNHRNCALWADMGVGKTVTTLSAIGILLDRFVCGRVLIAAPKRVAKDTWPVEIESWEHTKHLSYVLVQGSPAKRKKLLDAYNEITIINHELIPWLVAHFGRNWPFDVVILDEADYYKSPSSQRFKALKQVRKYTSRVIELTGTPASNSLLELWPQLWLLDQGERLETSTTKFKSKYFLQGYDGYSWHLQPGAQHAIQEKVKDICLRIDAHDHIDMPDREVNNVLIPMPVEAMKHYKQLEKEFVLQLEEETIAACNEAVLTVKLQQGANGALYTNPETGEYRVIHDAKLDVLEALMQAYPTESLLIATQFKSDIERIQERFPKVYSVKDTPDFVNRWNRREIQYLAGNASSISHGLNLQKGGRHIVWFSPNWSLRLNLQFNGRLERQGQTEKVMIHHLIMQDTVDEIIMLRLSGRRLSNRALMDALKAQIQQSSTQH